MSFEVEVIGGSTVKLPTAGKYCDRDIVVSAVENQQMEVHKITIASDLTSGANTLLANNAFIKENYNKPGFSIQLISLMENTTGPAVGYAYNGNRQFQNNVCGIMIVLSSSNDNNYRATTGNCYTANYSNVPYVGNEGNVKMQNSSTNGTLKAGDYLIILSVAEV